jgi:putative membrane protein
MIITSTLLVCLAAFLQFYFMVLEMFLWTKPFGRKTFGMNAQKAEETKVLAANQGLYNGFLAAGLIWGLLNPNEAFGFQVQMFFLICMAVAGVYGAATANRKILFVQALPAALALVAINLR